MLPPCGRALNLLYRKPIISAADIEQELSVTTPTANALIRDMMKLGILVEITGQQRGRVYAFGRIFACSLVKEKAFSLTNEITQEKLSVVS